MFDIGWSELVVIAVVAIVVIGPKDLPGALRQLGKAIAGMKKMASEFQSQFDAAMREAELDALKKEVEDLKRTATQAISVPDVASIARDEVKAAIEGQDAAKLAPPPQAPPADTLPVAAELTPPPIEPLPPPELPAAEPLKPEPPHTAEAPKEPEPKTGSEGGRA